MQVTFKPSLWYMMIVFVITLVFYVSAAPGENSSNSGDTVLPDVAFECYTDTYYLGTITAGSKPSAVFTFRNVSDHVLEITQVKKCCGAVTELSRETLEAGQSGYLKVSYHAGQNAGLFKKSVTLETSDPQCPSVSLTATGQIQPILACEPEQIEISMVGDQMVCPEVRLKSLDDKVFSIKSVNSSHQNLSMAYDPNLKVQEMVLKPQWTMSTTTSLTSIQRGTLQITLDHPDNPTLTLPFTVIPLLQVTPTQIIAFGVTPDQPLEKKIRLESMKPESHSLGLKTGSAIVCQGETPIKVTQVTEEPNGFTLTFEIMPPEAPKVQRFHSDCLTMTLSGDTTINVPIRLFYKSELK